MDLTNSIYNQGNEGNSTTATGSSRGVLWREQGASTEEASVGGFDTQNGTKSSTLGVKKKTKLGIEYTPSRFNLMNTPGHEEMLIEIYTYLTLEFAHTIAVVDKRFCELTKTCKWLPQTLLFTWGRKNHGHGQSSIRKPKLLQRFYSVRSQFQIKSIETSNNATFLLTHGGQVYCFGEMNTEGLMSNVMQHPQQPKLMKELSEHKIVDIKVSSPGYFHGRHYRMDHISIAALTDQNTFFQWGLNSCRQLMLSENDIQLAKAKKSHKNAKKGSKKKTDSELDGQACNNSEQGEGSNANELLNAERNAIHDYATEIIRDRFNADEDMDLNEEQMEFLEELEEGLWERHLEGKEDFVAFPTAVSEFQKSKEVVEQFSMGIYISAVLTRGVDGVTRVYFTKQRRSFRLLRRLRRENQDFVAQQQDINNVCHEVKEFAGKELKKIVCGGWFVCFLDDAGSLYTLGHPRGPDVSNGNLLGTGIMERRFASVPRLVNFNHFENHSVAPIVHISASSYSVLAIDSNGTCYSWGDSDGGALGHDIGRQCSAPCVIHRNIQGKDGCMSYTNGSICTADQELLFFGGGMWDHHQAISSYSVDSEYGDLIKRVNWDVHATLSGYEVKKLLLGHRHAIVVVGKIEVQSREDSGKEAGKTF